MQERLSLNHMARVAFIQEEARTRQGIMILSAVLKKHGHATGVFATDEPGEKVKAELKDFNPDILAFSTGTPSQKRALNFAREMKQANRNLYIMMGGPHPTFYPNVLEENEFLDAICIGEGEDALLETANNVGNIGKISSIRNLRVRDGRKIYRNDPRPLIDNLDELPDPDYQVYFDKFPMLANSDTKIFMVGRGCPFPCTYCFNKKYMDIYKGKGTYIRFKSISKIINEIKGLKKRYPIKWVQFNDDTFNINRKWLEAFLVEYRKEVGLGFLCNLRVDFIDEDLIKGLKAAGVDRIDIGIEHGNEEFRKKFLKRDISNEQIMQAGWLFHKYKIRFHTGNIVGFPDETLSMAFETVHINQKVGPDVATCGVLQPFPGTEIYNYVADRKILKKGTTIDDFRAQKSWTSGQARISSVIEQKNMRELINLHCFFALLVKHPSLEWPVRMLIKLPYNRLFQFVGHMGMFGFHWKYARGPKEKLNNLKKAFEIFFKKS